MKHLIRAALALALAAAGPLSLADTLLTMKNTEHPAGGGEPVVATSKIRLGQGRLREDWPRQSVILDEAVKKLFVIQHETKVYHAFDLPLNLSQDVPPEMRVEVTVTPTEETRKIGPYATKRYDVLLEGAGLTRTLELWVAPTMPFDVAEFKRLTLEAAGIQPAAGEWIGKILAIDGFAVLRESHAKVGEFEHRSSQELVSVEQVDADPASFVPPAGYTERPMDLRSMQPGR